MISLRENMLRVYRDREPEYTLRFSDFNSACWAAWTLSMNVRIFPARTKTDLARAGPGRK